MDSGNEVQTRKASNQNEKDDSINVFDQLPHDVATETLSKLPITSLVKLSYSCRSLNSLCHNPEFVRIHFSKASTNESECLIFHSEYPSQNELHFIRLSDNKARKIDVPAAMSMPEFEILGSSNGLLCLMDSIFPDSFCLYNPFRRGHFEIPKNSVFMNTFVAYGFGFHPVTNDYKLVMIGDRDLTFHHETGFRSYHGSDVQVYSVKSNAWQKKEVVPYNVETGSTHGVLVGGRLHWVSQLIKVNGRKQRTIITYDLGNDSFDVIFGPVQGSSRNWSPSHLVELDGCLSAVVPVRCGDGAFTVWILREYGGGTWVKTYNVGVYIRVPQEMGNGRAGRNVRRVLCVLRSGELLLEYRGEGNSLVTYDPRNMTFRRFECSGTPPTFFSVFHVAGLTSAAFPLSE